MPHSQVDSTIERASNGSFAYPLGVAPLEPVECREGYSVAFEASDGGEAPGDWEEWPDRYLFEIVVSATRLRTLCRALFSLLPGRVYPILDVLGGDAYREVDPYIAYDPVGYDRVVEVVRRHGDWLYEDGLVGFGAMSDEPFLYIYIDEHKIITVRAETSLREQVEKTLEAFDLSPGVEDVGVDTVNHEHRCVLLCPPDQPELLTAEEIIEEVCAVWRLRLNVDRHTNVDEDGRDLGITAWRCLMRVEPAPDAPARHAEVVLTAGCLDEADLLLYGVVEEEYGDEGGDESGEYPRMQVVMADRMKPDQAAKLLGPQKAERLRIDTADVADVRWIDGDEA